MHGPPHSPGKAASPLPPVDPALLQAAVEASGEAVVITTPAAESYRILYVNPAFSRMTGYQPEEVIGRTPRLLQGPETEPEVLERMHAALVAGQMFQGRATNYRKDGSSYMVEWLITPIKDAAGEITHWVSAQRDVSAEHEAEAQQQLMVRELHHRVKNTLTTVQAVMSATMREFQKAFAGRFASLAQTDALLTEDRSQAVIFLDLLRAELQPYENGSQKRITLQGPPTVLPSALAVPIGMAVHELTTNAAKYGALARMAGSRWSGASVTGRKGVGFAGRGTSMTVPPLLCRPARGLARACSSAC